MDRYAVFGNPVAHSQSPFIHTQFAAQFGAAIEYRAQLVDIGSFSAAAEEFFAGGGCGLNITLPFKQDAFNFAGRCSDAARLGGAVNTLRKEGKAIVGDNTDGVGLMRDLNDNLGWEIGGKTVLLLGAGGAVRGVLPALLQASPKQLYILNRTASKAEELVGIFSSLAGRKNCALACGSYDGSVEPAAGDAFDIVINGTSASLSGDAPPIAKKLVKGACCYDMMYGNDETVFLAWARQQGAAELADGLGMLVEQAAESYFLWRGDRPDTRPVIESLRASM